MRDRTVTSRRRRVGARAPWSVVGAALVIAALLLTALFANYVTPQDPLRQRLAQRLLPPFWSSGGNGANILGTDQLGRDVLSRIIFGARASLALSLVSVSLAFMLGTALGTVMGYTRGRVSVFLQRLTDVQLAFPFLILAIAIVAVFGATLVNLVIVLVLWSWPALARLARAQVLVEKEKEYIVAAHAIGATPAWIVWRDLLPSILPSQLVLMMLTLAQMIVWESALSFLGLGVPPPAPSWGSMLSDGRDYVVSAWWLITFPGLALMLTVLAFNTLGNYLQDRPGAMLTLSRFRVQPIVRNLRAD